ncbi:TonB-dependent receptor [Geofilum rubicundum JCM 15548]|uniref:TonB-dependent receptor n=2 Tax=Geofilum TaxID=1236988 RepID=A0A0E9LVZ0_9BACT|nr:TonB-dependent receptor [Geofilum rubicundum JCM 15548]
MQGWSGGSWDGSKLKSTDWTDFVTQTAITQEHSLSVSGGTEKVQAYGSFGYLDQEGTQIGQAYDRYTTKVSVDMQPKDWFSMGASLNASWSEQDYGMSTLGASSSTWPNSIYGAAKRVFSYAVPYDENGERILTPGGDGNVYTIIDEWNQSTQQRQTFRALASFYSQLDLGEIFVPLQGLKYRVNFGPDYRNWREGVYIDANSVNRLGGTSYARLRNQRDFSWTLDNLLLYDKSAGEHTFGITLLQTASNWNVESSSMNGQNVPNPNFLWNAFGSLDVTSPEAKVGIGSGLTERQLTSYMGRLNYSLSDRYLLTVSGRWDGASQLAEGHKWAFFPSAALGWRIEQEDFMQGLPWISQLKARLGFGSTGNAAVDPYQTLGRIQSFFVPFGGADNQQAYSINEPNYTSTLIPMANKELTWETTTQYNLGLDFSLFLGRVGGTIDIYQSSTKDLLMNMAIPTLTGSRTTYANVGETSNKGVDITLNTVNIESGDFRWTSNINAAWQKDQIDILAYGKNDMVDNTWFIGESISVIYGIEGDGLWTAEDAAEMDQFNANGHDFEVGMSKPVDQDGNYEINSEDRVIIGNRNPRWTLGFNNTFSYKGFELDLITYGRFGYQVATGGEGQIGRYNQREIDYWTPDNTDAEFQKPIYNEAGGDAYSSILGYRSGSFFKIRTISLGYNLPFRTLENLGIQNMKVYVQAKNPGTIYSDIEWLDMDLGGSTYNRGFVFGLNIGF